MRKRFRPRLRSAVMLWLSCGACAAPRHPEPLNVSVAWSLQSAQIVFRRCGPEVSDLYLLDRRTGSEQRLTPSESSEWAGRPSPDASRLAFVSLRDGNYEVYGMNLDGSHAANVTRHPDYDVLGAWSSGGTRLAFMSTRGF